MSRILSLAALALAMTATPAQAQQAASACRDGGPRCISVAFRDVEIADVAATFAEFSGTSIVLGEGARGRVTAEIRNQPWDTALRAILQSQNLDVRQVAPGLLRIDHVAMLATEHFVAPLVTRVFRLSYVSAGSIANVLQPMKTARGQISVHEDLNALVVTDTEEAIAAMAKLIGHPPR